MIQSFEILKKITENNQQKSSSRNILLNIYEIAVS